MQRRMDDWHHRTFRGFVELNAHRCGPTQHRVAYIHFYSKDTLMHSAEIVTMEIDDVMECSELNKDSPLVRWLLKQMTTYEPTTERIVGMVFDPNTVISLVLRVENRQVVPD